jgi:hypothetical protein
LRKRGCLGMCTQLVLFAAEPASPSRRGNGPPDVQRRLALVMTEEVKLELLAVAAARPHGWLKWNDFKVPREKYGIGFCMGHVLYALVCGGRLQEKYEDYIYEWKAA